MGDGIDFLPEEDIFGMLLEGRGRMFLLGLVYSVMSDCVRVETLLSSVIFLC